MPPLFGDGHSVFYAHGHPEKNVSEADGCLARRGGEGSFPARFYGTASFLGFVLPVKLLPSIAFIMTVRLPFLSGSPYVTV